MVNTVSTKYHFNAFYVSRYISDVICILHIWIFLSLIGFNLYESIFTYPSLFILLFKMFFVVMIHLN